MSLIHFNIGTNTGHRAKNLARAVACISETIGPVEARSDVYESEPWGYDSPNPFANVGINVRSDISPQDILTRIKRIEQTIAPGSTHRNQFGQYCDREIDIDIICIDNQVIDTELLQVPHPLMHRREFVLRPMAQIWPEWVHPLLGLTPRQIIGKLCNNQSNSGVTTNRITSSFLNL